MRIFQRKLPRDKLLVWDVDDVLQVPKQGVHAHPRRDEAYFAAFPLLKGVSVDSLCGLPGRAFSYMANRMRNRGIANPVLDRGR
jgi:hypothetical protein